MNKVRLGVIGIGSMGSSHSRWLADGQVEGSCLSAVCDIDEARRAWARENLPSEVRVYDNYLELLDSGEVDGVIIAVPHYLHPEMAAAALERGASCDGGEAGRSLCEPDPGDEPSSRKKAGAGVWHDV